MDSHSTGQFIFFVVLICLSAFFKISEISLNAISRLRIKQMSGEGKKGVVYILKSLENPGKMLNAILIGNIFVNVLAACIAASFVINMEKNGIGTIAVPTLFTTVIILVFGELIPKKFAASNHEKIALLVARPINCLTWLLSPVIYIFSKITCGIIKFFGGDSSKTTPPITESDLKAIINIGHERGVIYKSEKTIFENIFEFGGTVAKDVMTPRTDIVGIHTEATEEELKKVFSDEKFSRLPVYKDSSDNIIGVIHLKDFIFSKKSEHFSCEKIMRKPYYTYEAKPTYDLFIIMKTKRISMSIVLDEYGGTSGIITLEDLIEEIVGDISDEDDEKEEIQMVTDTEYIVDGSAKIEYVNEIMGIDLISDEFESIGGYVIGISGRIPAKGDVIIEDGLKFLIEAVDKNRIMEIRIHKE